MGLFLFISLFFQSIPWDYITLIIIGTLLLEIILGIFGVVYIWKEKIIGWYLFLVWTIIQTFSIFYGEAIIFNMRLLFAFFQPRLLGLHIGNLSIKMEVFAVIFLIILILVKPKMKKK
jgi:hypothetical protein